MIDKRRNDEVRLGKKAAEREMKHRELYGCPVDLTDWSLAVIDDNFDELNVTLKRVILKAAGEVLELALKEGGNAFFPIEWSCVGENPTDGYEGAPITDPNIIYFGFPFCVEEFEYAHLKCDLREMMDRLIEGYESGEGGPITGEEYRDVLARVSRALKDCAGKLDEALKREAK